MKDYTPQIQRIRKKLQQATTTDSNFRVFGAGSHKYKINAPVSYSEVDVLEQHYKIQLPECYKSFVLHIGNGGSSYLGSSAGPFFGVYPFGKNLDDLIHGKVEQHLKKESILHLNICEIQWDKMIEPLYEDGITDTAYEVLNGALYGGILPIGSQGCSFIHALILNGRHKGRIVNLDRGELSPPKFSEDSNFLDWYERWLDEIITEKLITISPSWFGYPKH